MPKTESENHKKRTQKGRNEHEWMENEVERRYLDKPRNLTSKPYLFQGWLLEMMMILKKWRG